MEHKNLFIRTQDDVMCNIDLVAEFLGITVSAVRQRLYNTNGGFPHPIADPTQLMSEQDLREAFSNLLLRAGGNGKPLQLWSLNEIASYRREHKKNRGKQYHVSHTCDE